MDKRINYRLVIDTETCPIKRSDKVNPYNMLVYDIGFAVVDKRGLVYESASYINKDIFYKEQEKMNNAYYSEKISKYLDDIENGTRIVASFYEIRQQINAIIEKYNINEIYAHNMFFDRSALNNTMRYLTNGKYFYYFKKDLQICDTLKMAKDVLGNMPTYIKFCKDNGYITKNGKPRFTAEVIYRYITKDTNFIESHTGLEDVLIEKEILAYCYKQHKRMRKYL